MEETEDNDEAVKARVYEKITKRMEKVTELAMKMREDLESWERIGYWTY